MKFERNARAYHCAKFVIKDEGVEFFNDWYDNSHLEWCVKAFKNIAAYRFQAEESPAGTKTFYAVYVWDCHEDKTKGLATSEMPALLEHGELLKPYVVDQKDIDFNELISCIPE